ncbi:ArsR/SmtB family transcription factor [Anaerocolumna chitinilytica]|uniref:Transcriptional regulator n=1 Tax=Anaerocolumna chitinilytica TaxID=1727145 RepID=A0A7I8DQA0_9FIRM|nr:helix-turn-helix domain-containing protein [Anaerocolumna chitinilytica]BCK00463.1 transcriptional regulator [Anaerocolumna chitinilytica]
MKIKKKRIALDFNNKEKIVQVGKALSSEVRLDILKFLIDKSANISEIASTFQIPFSSAALHVKVLEEAGMITATEQAGVRGAQKVCGIAFEDIYFNAFRHKMNRDNMKVYHFPMGIGNYYNCMVNENCGIISERSYLGVEDSPYGFYAQNRHEAQLIWFMSGYLEYRFPNYMLKQSKVKEVSFSFEVCSEAPGYQNDWSSDITVWVNGREIATVYSKGDFGGRRGHLNPDWWSDTMTQFGVLKNVTINGQGCFEDLVKTSEETIDTLGICEDYFISFKIGVKPDAKNLGGMNLFGEKFGDYAQGIVMSVLMDGSGEDLEVEEDAIEDKVLEDEEN